MPTATKMNGAANASSFWASKSATIKNSTSPTPAFKEPPTPAEAAAAAKKSLVLKGKSAATTAGRLAATDHGAGMANGTAPSSTPKKTDWADSDDDEDFLASFSAKKNPRVTTLESEVAQKKAVIEGLEATVGAKDARIQQLEDVVAEKALHMSGLEADMEEKDAHVEKLKDENHTQYLYVQELVAEVDEKSRRVQELETELDVKGARIRELEMEAQPKPRTRDSAEDAEEPDHDVAVNKEAVSHSTDNATPTDKEMADQTAPIKSTESGETTSETSAKDIPESPATSAPNDASPKEESAGPAINESKFPLLWSPDKPKKVIPPVEKPKTLVMAIDTSKFGKKPAPVVLKKKPEPVNGKGFSTPSYGQSTKHRAKTDVVPAFNVDKDIRQMPHAQRVLYANGPEVTVTMGGMKLATLPKYVLMQCSGKAYKYFTEHPGATSLTFAAGCMDADAAIAHLQWMDEMTYQGRVYSLTLNGDEKFDLKNLKICQAARVMGLNNTYVGHFTKVLCDRIRSNTSSLEFLSAICELAYPANDPIFECLANNLVNQQGSKAFKRTEDLETLLAKYPDLEEKMAKIAVRVKNSRAADKRKGAASRDGSKNRSAAKSREADKNPTVARGG